MDAKSRARVIRLIGENFRPDDLTGLFLYARDHCDGRESVADIGHFVAHHDERDRGIITRSTRDWITTTRFHMSRFGPGGPHALQGSSLPPATKDYLEIAVNLMPPKYLKKEAGLTRSQAYPVASRLAGRLKSNDDGTWALPQDLAAQEHKLLECLASMMVVQPAFEAERLASDFLETLKSNSLITKDELRNSSSSISELVRLYAVSAMHNAVIIAKDGSRHKLISGISEDKISVLSAVSGVVPGSEDQKVISCIFNSELDPQIHCSPELLATAVWDFEIEIGPDRLLSRLQ